MESTLVDGGSPEEVMMICSSRERNAEVKLPSRVGGVGLVGGGSFPVVGWVGAGCSGGLVPRCGQHQQLGLVMDVEGGRRARSLSSPVVGWWWWYEMIKLKCPIERQRQRGGARQLGGRSGVGCRFGGYCTRVPGTGAYVRVRRVLTFLVGANHHRTRTKSAMKMKISREIQTKEALNI